MVLRASGFRSNGSGATHHQTENPIIAQRANTNRMSLQYEYTIASDSLKVLIREVSRFISEKPILLSGERSASVSGTEATRGPATQPSRSGAGRP